MEARLGPAVAIPLASALFGALHVDPVHAVFAGVLGLYLGLAAHLAGSVRAAIGCHALNNLLAVAVAARWADAELTSPASTALGFAVAAACLWAVDRRAPVPARAPHPGPARAPHSRAPLGDPATSAGAGSD
jgi:membrane protease YdiL (CAAX protease family)